MKQVIVIVILVFFLACNNSGRPKKPDNLIAQDRMANIIYDVFILNSAKGINKKTLEINGIYPQEYIYEKYKIDSLQFASSNNYYAFDTETYKSIVDKVKSKLKIEKEIYEALKKKEFEEEKTRKRLEDSIKRLSDTIKKTKRRARVDMPTDLPAKKKH
ncbi:hypothetical protein A9Q87_03260 [Flavobacteriales bacterium 34_180_T64]|nr:hypothetical protein A9Q87_03260 [Flavobacteriales bacterium 34_180_T64]